MNEYEWIMFNVQPLVGPIAQWYEWRFPVKSLAQVPGSTPGRVYLESYLVPILKVYFYFVRNAWM